MSAESTAPVERGFTFYGTTQTIDTSSYAGISLEGQQAVFQDTAKSDTTQLRSGRKTEARLMRNVSGSTVYAGDAVTPAAGYENERFEATYTKACRSAGIVDDRLGTSGCRNGDMCWVLQKGPAYYQTPSASPTTSIGDLLYVKNNDGGRLTPKAAAMVFGTTDVGDGDMGKILANSLGRAMEASAGGETDTAKLIDLGAAVF